jgi:protein-S-isoprenylcysteine O-methyltransferase Ste14
LDLRRSWRAPDCWARSCGPSDALERPFDPYTPSQALVTDGPYRLTRNPGYLGMALTYAGIAIACNAPWALVPLPAAIAVIDRGVIAREERYLTRKFGTPYEDYKRRVRRWI